jgi:hypothetical protein
MKRRLFNLAAALSLVMMLAVAALRVRSYGNAYDPSFGISAVPEPAPPIMLLGLGLGVWLAELRIGKVEML